MEATKERVLEDYMSLRSLDCKSKDSLGNYKRYLTRFLATFEDFDNLKEMDLISYVQTLESQHKQTTLNVIHPLLKNFIKWKYRDYSTRFPMLDRILKTKKALPVHRPEEMLTIKEVLKIIEEEDDLFWKAFWLVYSYGGFRPIDTARLKWEEFNWESDGSIVIKTVIGKNKKMFYKHIPADVVPIIDRWKEFNHSEWVFPSPKLIGKHINPKSVPGRLRVISKKAIGKPIIPYIMRKSIATKLYEDLPDDEAADAMGHSKSMKETYARLNDSAKTKRAKRTWTNKKEMPIEEKKRLEAEIKFLNEKIDTINNWSKSFQEDMQKRNDKILKDFMEALEKESK